MRSMKVKLHPDAEQIKQMEIQFGCSRFAYNWALNIQQENHKNGGKFISDIELRREFTQLKKQEEYKWLYNTANNVTKQAIKDLCNSYKRFFNGTSSRPKFKSKKKSKKSFYNDTGVIKFSEDKVKLEKLGWIYLAEKERIPVGVKYFNPRITFDGISYWISVAVEVKKESNGNKKTSPIGIDLGVKTLAVCSNGYQLHKPNISNEKKKLKRMQRKASRQYRKLQHNELTEKSNRLLKLEKQIIKQHQRITNVLDNNIHQFTSFIVKQNPKAVVIEDLDITRMMKNKSVNLKLNEAKFYEFRRQLEYKCTDNDINLIIADRWFPSSKNCSTCGNKKSDLTLGDRTYKCDECLVELDRDLNAALNLMKLAL